MSRTVTALVHIFQKQSGCRAWASGTSKAYSAGSRAQRAPAPSWAETRVGSLNTRRETAGSNAMFRSAFKSRRGIVPASGFYEW